jgi:hypothetical protein
MRWSEPIVFRWNGGEASLGYLGSLRWRVRVGEETIEASHVRSAIGLVFDAIFRGVPRGSEVAARSPLELDISREHLRFTAAPKFTNGWRFRSSDVDGDVGPHGALFDFVAERVARAAERAWTIGVEPVIRPSLAPRFSFEAFATAPDPAALCRELEAELNLRLRGHPSASTAFDTAMKELEAAGHDLWSILGDVWGPDYMTPRQGAGLRVTRFANEEDDSVANTVAVEFKP